MLDESNKYMQAVQEELENRNWRDIIAEAATREDAFQQYQEEDPEVDELYAKLEKQVLAGKQQQQPQLQIPMQPPVQVQVPPVLQAQTLHPSQLQQSQAPPMVPGV